MPPKSATLPTQSPTSKTIQITRKKVKKNKSQISIISWNLNGLSSNMEKGTLLKLIQEESPDILCLQEIKCQDKKLNTIVETLRTFYPYIYWNCAAKKGYSGTMILSRIEPLSNTQSETFNVSYGMEQINDTEGRLITAEFEEFILVTCYTPNSKSKLERLSYRTEKWEPAIRQYIANLQQKKPVIYCGDLNVAHQEIDLANPGPNKKKAGFTIQERQQLTEMLNKNKMIDTFRFKNPETTAAYTFWSNFAKSRERNIGWRIDYFLVSSNWITACTDSQILSQYMGSDHAPIRLLIKLP